MRLFQKIIFLLLFSPLYVAAQQSHIAQRIFLVGDAGEMQGTQHPVCDWLKQHIDWNDTTNVLIYLGDNIYPQGMPAGGSKGYAAAKEVLDYQLSVVQGKKAQAFFVPGNHDWKQGKPTGLSQVRNEWEYVNSLQWPNVQVIPANGCPGPVDVQVGDKVVLVFMDSQWWLQQGEKTGLESDCDFKTEEEVLTALKDIISSYPDKLIVLAMHHPFYTHGKHGGYFTLKQHLFPLTEVSSSLYIPLPVIGSVYPVARGVFGNIQDTKHPQYKNLISHVEEIMKQHPNVVHAAGHEHALQFLVHDSVPYIVSGAGSKTTKVKMGKNSLFARSETGFAMIEVTSDGKVAVKFYNLQSSDLEQPIYTAALNSLPVKKVNINEVIKSFPDSVTVAGSTKFKSSGFRNFLLGKNYRDEWKTPVRVKVIDMGTAFGGLTPMKRGGGHQTKSLRMKTLDDKQYVLRMIEKSVTDAALPADFRGAAVAKDLISDGVSASYPYAALSVPVLADAAGVPHTHPQLVYVPDDPRLGKFRSDFGNTFCLIEERVPDTATKKAYSTDEMVDKLHGDNDNTVDQKAMLQARLLDMFIMDFDRHEDQWQWGVKENDKGKTFYPLPRDRDQVFFISKGFLPSIARQSWISPQVQGFRAKAININTYNFNAKNMDRAFLTEMNEEDWKKMADDLLATMTDEKIEEALHNQPKEIEVLPSNKKIIQTLKKRKKYFVGEMMKYYRFLSAIVSVTGSDKKELFDIDRHEDGSVIIKVNKITKEGEVSTTMYERKFYPADTKEICLYGMGGDDKFIVHGTGNKIKIRMIGGAGKDVFESNTSSSSQKNIAYDLKKQQNEFAGNNNIRKKLSDDTAINKYDRLSYKYNLIIPLISVGYNPDDGIYLGTSLKMIQQGFHKTPYKTTHQFISNHSLATKAYNFRYNAEFVGALGKKSDLLINVDVRAPKNTANFFGYGNGSVFDETKSGKVEYYRARYTLSDLSLLMRTNFNSTLSMLLGPAFEYYSMEKEDNMERFITKTNLNGLDSSTLYKRKYYAGAKMAINIDNRNNKTMPSRGINWQNAVRVLSGISKNSKTIMQVNSDLSVYVSFSKRARFVLALRVGAGHNFGKFEFFQAQYLGGMENLRGYRKNRFAGESILFNNIEMRLKIADFNTYLFPGSIGILAFHDMGRVWAKDDPVAQWHNGYGAGIWLSPLKRIVITASYTRSEEEVLPLVTLGWQF